MLPINKIYIDTRHKTPSSKSNSDFDIQLKEPINLPDNTVCVVSDIVLRNTITTVEDFNNNLFVRCNGVDRVVTLFSRNYNVLELGFEIESKLNTVFPQGGGLFSFIEDVFNTKVVIEIAAGNSFQIFTDDELRSNSMNWKGDYYDKFNIKSANHTLANFGSSRPHSAGNPFISERIHIQNLEYVLLSCFGLGYSSYSSREGERHIIKKIPLPPYGEHALINFFDINDSMPVHRISLSKLKFMVTDPYGNTIDLHGSNLSFSLIFTSNE